jgi:outer membrane lipoprotein-sorting protein
MRRLTITLLIALLGAGVCLAQNNAEMTADEIVDKAEEAYKGETSVGVFTMKIVRPDYTRQVTMKAWNKGNEKALVVTKAPKKEAGNKLLKIGNELWQYLDNTETTMKLPASMMLNSWNGSDLTYDDMVRESNLVDDYDLSIMFEEKIAGEECWKIKLTPRPEAAVVWGKLYYWVRKSDYLPALVQYYGDDGKLKRTMKFYDISMMDGRKIPLRWKVIDEEDKGEYTLFIYKDVEFNVDIPDRIFSFRELER